MWYSSASRSLLEFHFLLKKLRWYDDPRFRDLEAKPPSLPVVSYTLARDDGSVVIAQPKSDGKRRTTHISEVPSA